VFTVMKVPCLSFNDFIIIKVLCLSWLLESDDPKFYDDKFMSVN
jgi:hypothetical protein